MSPIRPNTFFHFLITEAFVEALPQVFVQLTILGLSFDNESDAYGILNPYGHVFQASFSVSILSATLGMTKFLKNGPCQLIPRDSYGCGFFTAMLITLFSLLAKGSHFTMAILGTSWDFLDYLYESGSSTQSMSYEKRSYCTRASISYNL